MTSSLALCLVAIGGSSLRPVLTPDAGEHPVTALGPVLGGLGLSLVAIPDAERFGWGGHWLAELADGRFVVRFGTPESGTVLDPQGGPPSPVVAGWVMTPLDLASWSPPVREAPGTGRLESILLAAAPTDPCILTERAEAVPGRGLVGDRYWAGTGSMGSGRPGMEVTLVDGDVLRRLGIAPAEARRNLVTTGVDLDALVGRSFRVGAVRLAGRRRCEPCAHLARVAGRDVLRPLVHQGGLRADVLTVGTLAVGDVVGAEP